MKHLLGVGLTAFYLAAMAMGCTTTETASSGEEGPQKLYYTLRAADPVKHTKPLPTETDILVDWHYDNGMVKTYRGFRGWDLDGSGRFGMVEVLSDDGTTQSYVYDFDGDGRIDFTESVNVVK